jgi:hypothetical protein
MELPMKLFLLATLLLASPFHAAPINAQRILFLGNSITMHGAKPSIGWSNNCGMAASALDKDYVHVLTRAERKFEHAGVANHPGDKGMQAIADALLKAIKDSK